MRWASVKKYNKQKNANNEEEEGGQNNGSNNDRGNHNKEMISTVMGKINEKKQRELNVIVFGVNACESEKRKRG